MNVSPFLSGGRGVACCLIVAFWSMLVPCFPGQEEDAGSPFAPPIAPANPVDNLIEIEIGVRIEGANLNTLPLDEGKIETLTKGLVVKTHSGSPARIEVIREAIHPVEVDAAGEPVKFDVENLGFSLEVDAVVQNDGVACRLEAVLVEIGEMDEDAVLYSFVKSTASHKGVIAPNKPLRLKLRTKSGDLATVVVSAKEVR